MMIDKMKRIFGLCLAVFILISGCGQQTGKTSAYQKYSYEFTGPFDTMIQFIGYTENQAQWDIYAKKAQARLEELHRMFDIYHDYPGLNNVKTINDNAGIKPVQVPQEVADLIAFSKEWSLKTGGRKNIALGPVLSIWHDYREEGVNNPGEAKLPPMDELEKALLKTDIRKVKVDAKTLTVFLPERGMSLDVGGIAKGYSTEIIARELEQAGMISGILDVGGNVRVIGKPMDGIRNKWGIGIQNPGGNPLISDETPLDTIYATDTSVVTSGDYQRYYVVNGERYSHIIDPTTLMPAKYYRAVTVMTKDSAVADFMSSALFLLPYEESRKLALQAGLEALWIFPDGRLETTDGMRKALKGLGGASYK